MEQPMNPIKWILSFIKAGGVLLGTIIGVLASANDSETSDRPQGDGSDLFGEHNFKTGRADSGSDPDGWYEDDM
jgi:hypothetical protein